MSDLPLLTNSRLRTFRECPRKHQFAYVEGWKPTVTGEALRIGSLIHLGLEQWWAAPDEQARQFSHLAVEGLAIDPFEQAKIEEMLRFYDQRWTDERAQYEVLAVESEFRAPLLNPETGGVSRSWTHAGKIDAVVRRRSDGRVLVVEHKSTVTDVRGDDADYWTMLSIDPQISGYVIGAESLGHQVDEILYDVLVKPSIRPLKATPVEARKFTKDGRLYTAQREFDETPDEYRVRLQETIASDMDRYYARRSVPRSNSQIQDFQFDAWQQAATMRESERLGRAPRNPDACLRMGRCPYWLLCSTGGKPEDYPADFVKTDTVNPELGGNDASPR